MKITDRVYVSRELKNMGPLPNEKFALLAESMKKDAALSTRIRIVSGYYGQEYVIDMLKAPKKRARARCQIVLLFGYENATELVHGQIQITELKRQIVGLGYKEKLVDIRLFKSGVPLHSKLYCFLKGTSPVWYVGSANLSKAIEGARHELMVRITGKSEALDSYVNALLSHQESANSEVIEGRINGITEFFSHGYLLFRPSRHNNFTYDAFNIKPDDRRKISNQLGSNEVPHLDPEAKGFGFNLLSALEVAEDTKQEKRSKVQLRRFCIETAYGYWIPKIFALEIRQLIATDAIKQREKFSRIGIMFSRTTDNDIILKFKEYLEGSHKYFSVHGIQARPREDQVESFKKFLDMRRTWLHDPAWIERNSSKYFLEEMPNIWSDTNARERFISSFCEDVVAVLNSAGKKPMIYGRLKKRLKLPYSPDYELVRTNLAHQVTMGIADKIFGPNN